jgi:spermidine synthase
MKIRSIGEYHEKDREHGIERIYLYRTTTSDDIQTQKQSIDFLDSTKWGKMIFLDGVLQSTTRDEIMYHTVLVHPIMDTVPCKEKILILGGGEGATAREVLRWKSVKSVTMVDHDSQFVNFMKIYGQEWSKGVFNNSRLHVVINDAWKFMEYSESYDCVIIDLTDPDLTKNNWKQLLTYVFESIALKRGGFVMNAGLYIPWDTKKIKTLQSLIEELLLSNKDYRYMMYTNYIPSFNGEWTFLSVFHKDKFMKDPSYLSVIPDWIRRSTKVLDNRFIQDVSTEPQLTNIVNGSISYECSIT